MELVQKQVRYMQEKPSITDQFQMDEDYNVPDTKDDVKQIVRSKETVALLSNFIYCGFRRKQTGFTRRKNSV